MSKYLLKDNKEKLRLVYCTKCGTLNPDGATNCSNCGAPLYGANVENRPYTQQERRQRYYAEGYGHRRRGSGFGLLIAGLIIILVGLALFFGTLGLFFQYFWPIVIVLIGVWLLARGLMRNRRYRQTPPP
jgi:hypothetical protein